MKILIVGQNPKIVANLTDPFKYTPSGRKLDKWLDYFLTAIPTLQWDIVNATDRLEMVGNRYFQEDIEFIKEIVKKEEYDGVLALGNYASGMLHRAKVKHFKLPHPSGLNRRLNAAGYEQGQLDNCLAYLLNF